MANKQYKLNSIINEVPNTGMKELKLTGNYYKDVTIQVKRFLSLTESVEFVRDVVATCVDTDKSECIPELLDFATRVYVLKYYANIDMSKNVDKAYVIVYNTDLYDRVIDIIHNEQHTMLIDAIFDRIEQYKSMFAASAASGVSQLMHKMDEFINENTGIMDSINNDVLNEAIESMSKLGLITSGDNEVTDSAIQSDTDDNITSFPDKRVTGN